MKTILLPLMLFYFATAVTSLGQSLEEQLLGKWKLVHDEGMEAFLNSPFILQQPREEYNKTVAVTNRVLENSYMDFYSLDSLTSTVIDRKDIIQDKSIWNIRKADSVITYQIRFPPYTQQSKVIKINEQELILVYISQKQNIQTLRSTYKKVESY
jgi:hypothetical protein